MAREVTEDWDEPLPSSESVVDSEAAEEEDIMSDERRHCENMEKLQKYVYKMAYRPIQPTACRTRTAELARPKAFILGDNYNLYNETLDRKLRAQRLKRVAGKHTAISTEQLEQIIKNQRAKERKKEDLLKRKQEIYYELLTKLEHQCRTQYLNVLIKKFTNFIAKLATTMRIPPQLVEPYARMQRCIFCNILSAIGVQQQSQGSVYYSNEEALKYEVCDKLAHALLSLIIKALDLASTKTPADIPPLDTEFVMDNFIKEKLMCAAEKKISNARHLQAAKAAAAASSNNGNVLKKCLDL